jgi:NADH-quinone oxidoreductase subunit M
MAIVLLALVLIPLIGAVAALFLDQPKRVSVITGSATLALSVLVAILYAGSNPDGSLQSVIDLPVFAGLFSFALGVDGLSVVMLLLTGLVTFGAVLVTPDDVSERGSPNLYHACVLFIAAGAIGAFASTDLFFFYAFHELALIPTFLMIAIWGNGDRGERVGVAWRVTLYLVLGSFILLLGLMGLFFAVPAEHQTFSIPEMLALGSQVGLNEDTQLWVFPLLLIGFGVLISLFPFHSWAPAAYATAPTPVTMLHAGVLKKFGLYGLLRLAIPLLPEAWAHYAVLVQILLIGNIIYIGMVTIAQKRLGMMLGYSSVMHMGYVFLGLVAYNQLGVSGAALLIFAHGISIALLFALTGEIRDRVGTLEFDRLGGLAQKMPVIATLFILGGFASIGLPGFANFASEVLIFLGAFSANPANPLGQNMLEGGLNSYQITTAIALWGVVISAVYMLRAIRSTFFGPVPEKFENADSPALTALGTPTFLAVCGLFLLALLVVGLFPQTLTSLLDTPAFHLLRP